MVAKRSARKGGAEESLLTVTRPELLDDGSDDRFRALVHASVLRLDAGAEPSAIAMAGSELAATIVDCGLIDAAAVDDFQRTPERSLTTHASPDGPAGSLLFARFLDDTYGTGVPSGVLFGLLAVAGQRTAPGALHFANEPDVFDARGIDRERGALVVVRPDMYVAAVLPLEATERLAAFFSGVLRTPAEGSAA